MVSTFRSGQEAVLSDDGQRVAILGGGPAGAFCAIWLARLAGERGASLDVTIYDYKDFEKPGPAGCNMCAGLIPGSLVAGLLSLGVELPERVIQRRIEGYHLHVRGGAADIPAPAESPVYATFRGPGPLGIYPAAQEGFDWWLLSEAEQSGATHLSQFVTEVRRPEHGTDPFVITCRDGSRHEADIVIGAFGVNSNLVRVFEEMGFGYRAPRTVRARQAEIPLDPEFIARVLRNRVVILATGRPGLQFAAITPKRQHATVTLIGDNPSQELLREVLDSPDIRRHFPPGWEPPEQYCACTPRMPVSAALNPVADRLLVIGDANISRYVKNGIESSFHTAMWAAQAITSGVTREHIRRHYVPPCHQAYLWDNAYGRALFRAHDVLSRSALITRAHLSVVREEQDSDAPDKPLSRVLLGLFIGSIPYRTAVRTAFGLRLQWRLLKALAQTAFGHLPPGVEAPHAAPQSPSRGGLGPVGESQTVVVIGGGPAGTSCAIALARARRESGGGPRVVLVEAKRFGEHHNQCAGVLSAPGPRLLSVALGGAVPETIYQRRIAGYVLHGSDRALRLDGEALGETPLVLRRVELDALLLDRAKSEGVKVVPARATEVEVGRDGVVVYTEGDCVRGDAVVGAFALDQTMAHVFARQTAYRPPAALGTLTCKIHPAGLDPISGLLDDCIHVFLPRLGGIEFGALIPKGNHITVLIAGARLQSSDLEAFLTLEQVARLLPRQPKVEAYYKGAFPLGPARGICDDRYVVIGDAAGLVRPFKGKGINCALESGQRCAQIMLGRGLSAEALAGVAQGQGQLMRDAGYGRLVRRLVMLTERFDLLDPFLLAADRSAPLRQALFDCVSGRTTYRDVVLRPSNLTWLMPAARLCLARMIGRDGSRRP